MKRANPMAANPRTTAFRVRMRRSRSNAASTEMSSWSSSTNTSPSTDPFSCWPRTGSGSRKANSETTTTGMMGRKNAHRHPLMPPTAAAMPAMTRGLSAPAVWLVNMVMELSRPRTPMGYWSAIIEPCTEMVDDLEIPAPNWAKNSMKALTARPMQASMAAKANPAQAMIGPRR